jgi:heptosyltransferase-2
VRPASRVLVVAPNWLGDAVMSTPLLTWLDAVRRAPGGPALRVTLAVRGAWAPLFTGDPRVDELMIVERPGLHDGWRGIVRQAMQWRAQRFEAALLGPPSLRAAATAALAGIPCRIGHRGDGRDVLLTRALARQVRGRRHFSLEMLDLGLALGDVAGWDARRLPKVEDAGPARLAGGVRSAPKASPGSRPLWVLGPGTTYGPAKTWPTRPTADFAAAAVAEERARILLLGDGNAAPLVAALRAATPGLRWAVGAAAVAAEPDADVIDLTGATDLPEATAWLRACGLYVGNDSGLMHVAAALGTPTLGLYGSSNPDWTRPTGPFVQVLAAEGFACRPCYRRTCNQPVFCLETVEGPQVLAAARRLLLCVAASHDAAEAGGSGGVAAEGRTP